LEKAFIRFYAAGSSTSENITPSASGTGFAYVQLWSNIGGHVTLAQNILQANQNLNIRRCQDYDNDQKIALLLVSIGVDFSC